MNPTGGGNHDINVIRNEKDILGEVVEIGAGKVKIKFLGEFQDGKLFGGIIRKPLAGLKVLGNGNLEKALTVKANKFSASAKEAIEKAGGTAEEI